MSRRFESHWISLDWRRAALVCLASALAGVALGGNHRSATGVSVLENTPNRVIIEYTIPSFTQTAVEVGGHSYLQIALPGEPQLLIAGAPDLPHIARSIVIPDSGVMEVRVSGAQYDELPAMDLAPSKGNLLRTVNPDDVPFSFGDAYKMNAFFPGDVAKVHEPYILRDRRGVVVDIYPFQYNPVTRSLRVYSSLTVEVARVADGGPNVLERGRAPVRPSVAFEELYRTHFINHQPDLRYNPLNETGDILVICYDQWLPNIQPYVDHKNSVGISTTALGVSTIPGGNTATAIKNYIQTVYDQGDLAFVLLVGDAVQVATPSASGGASDPSYAKLAGSDNYPDIMVGRFSAETAAQLDTQVLRTVEYENMPATEQAWFWRGMGIASNQGPGDDGEYDYEHIDNIRNYQLLPYGYISVDQIYDPSATKAMITNGLNAGRGIINYCGHGSQTSWGTTGFSNTDVNALANENMLPFIISVACNNGEFNTGTCFGEAWLRATHGGEPSGAVGAYMSSISQSWNPPMEAQDEFNIRYVANTYNCYGTLCFAGSCSMMDEYGADGVNMFNTWILFGDPSLRIVGVVTPPHGIKVTPEDGYSAQGPIGGPFTPPSFSYTVTNLGDVPLSYEVTATQDWVSIENASGTLPGKDATATVTVSINSNANYLGTGLYTDTINFVNATNHDGDVTRPVALKIGVPTVQYSWNLDADPGWPVEGQWAWGDPTGQGGAQHGYPDPQNGATGTNVIGVNLNGDYSTALGGPWYVTLGPVDLTATTEVSLRFQRWLNSDYEPYVYATIDASNNGTSWTPVWSNGGQEIKENAWSLTQYDLAVVADNQATVWVRWGYKVGGGAYAYSGWNIDDIQIWGLHATGPLFQPGDLNCDHAIDFGDINPFVMAITDPAGYVNAFPNCNIMLADINGDGQVNFGDINPFIDLLEVRK